MEPLASKLRPQNLDEFIGQEHLVSSGKPLRLAIENKQIFSFILWGPPGVGKTTLARIYANALDAQFFEISAVNAGKEDIRKIIDTKFFDKVKVLFIDEIHRFNKAQQDFLLPYVEDGRIILIGATTENPSFEVISALLSRCRVFILNPLTQKDLEKIINRANYKIDKEAMEFLINVSNYDARQALTILESTHNLYKKITVENIKNIVGSKFLKYDKNGEEHYNLISAFIKSMRASNVDSALYYLARLIESGEDPKFIARRMVIFASEDIGLASNTALVIANEVFKSVEVIGLPECQINLAHGVVVLCKSQKDRSAYDAYFKALEDVKNYGNLPIPLNLRNAPTKFMKNIGYGKNYEMYSKESLLPEDISDHKYY